MLFDNVMFIFQVMLGQEGEVVVDLVDLSFVVGVFLFINVNGGGDLIIFLELVDGELVGEFFFVYGEDGMFLG